MEADPDPVRPKIGLQQLVADGIWSRRRCIMSGAMPIRRKINTRAGRVAARERVRQLVGEHDDQVVMLIWGGRILGWSLRKIPVALEGSIAPPVRLAGYTAGVWTAAAGQRIFRRHNNPTNGPAEPPRWFLSSVRRHPMRSCTGRELSRMKLMSDPCGRLNFKDQATYQIYA